MASLHGSALQAEGDDILIAQQRTFIEAMVQQERPAGRVDVANGSWPCQNGLSDVAPGRRPK